MPARRSRRRGDDDVSGNCYAEDGTEERNILVHTRCIGRAFFPGGTLLAANAALLSVWLSLEKGDDGKFRHIY